ncbi:MULTISPECIES: type III secretion protein HrpF [unclassified Brenneria]|uniref:type III secretion protein HrpF n=1 Tax=unclassified Brenneria TaxID=2634434 RepID=UPI001555EA43|nr:MULTISPECIES: type III secretion protein HrpF [unclassified Brenneria]MBJ7220886.1 type III secretion protein HrpF [Brenneria sp. L3-3C-1]MEE3642126.1 type III secretion protein HrpF [Brenneria sp. L3_3C_1]MEE3650500.1 type III secretion protein HrpF [Brenneria sp. HEZEL_4_2_4]NPD00456.1 serine kinase [Brenneria sp. hezel4-2-4]
MAINPTQRRLDTHLVNAQQKLDDIALNVADGGASQADSFAFFEASMDYSNASWAVGQLLSVKHGLAKAIINDFN